MSKAYDIKVRGKRNTQFQYVYYTLMQLFETPGYTAFQGLRKQDWKSCDQMLTWFNLKYGYLVFSIDMNYMDNKFNLSQNHLVCLKYKKLSPTPKHYKHHMKKK